MYEVLIMKNITLNDRHTISQNDAKLIVERLHDEMKSEYEKISKGRLSGLLKIPKRIHSEGDFVLELIQNADDANSENLFIEWIDNRIMVQNDGDPFEEVENDPYRQNVSAICEFDKTTKLGNKIGFMGIGFKSVFKISEHVEIYSGPFRFYFDERMCVPQWVSSPCDVAEARLSKVSQKGSIFCIHVSERDRKDIEPIREIIKRLSSDMLLWLQNLRTIHYEQKTIEKKKGPISHSFRLIDNSKERLYRCFSSDPIKVEGEPLKQLVKVRNVEYKDWEKVSVTKSVAISFPVDEKGKIKKIKGRCYAFLPLPEVDLQTHFDIQGDFNVELRRKALKSCDDLYNNWLFELVGMAWKRAFECYKKYEDPKMALQMYRIAPIIDEENGDSEDRTKMKSPFETVKRSIDNFMKNHDTVLAEVPRRQGRFETKWTKPSLCALPLQNDLRKLFSSMDLKALVGKELYWVSKHIPDEGIKYLEQLGKSGCLDALDFISDWQKFETIARNKAKEKNAHEWFAEFSILVAELYNEINHYERYSENWWTMKQKLVENFPILLSNRTVCRKGENSQIFYTPPGSKKLKEIESSTLLQFIHPKIFTYLRKKTNNDKVDERRTKAIEFLEKNILTVLDPKGRFETIILPKLEKEEPSKLGEKYLDEVVTFLFQNRTCWDIAENKVPLKAVDGNWYLPNELYLSSPYGGHFDATIFFGGIIDSALLAKDYLRKLRKFVSKKRKDPKKEIREFFEKLGVNTRIVISSNSDGVWISGHDLENRIGKKPRPTRHSGYQYSGYKIQDPDFADERVLTILTECSEDKENANNSFNRLSVFLHELIWNWQEFSKDTKAHYYRYDPDWTKVGRQSQVEEEVGWSKWVEFLSRPDITWIPAKLGERALLVGPRGALLDRDTARSSIPIVHVDECKGKVFQKNLTEFSKFFRFVGWEATPGLDEIVAGIHSMCERKIKDKKAFIDKYNLLRAEIEKILDFNQRTKIISQLDSCPWVFTPGKKTKYRTSVQIQWESRDELLDWKVGIRRIYPEMEYFFKDLIKIHSATAIEYIAFLRNVLWKKRPLSKKEFETLCNLYMRLNASLSDDGSGELVGLEPWQEVKTAFKFYCKDNSWHTLSEGVYFVDDENFLTQLRGNRRGVFIVKLSPTLEKNPPLRLFEETGLHPLTSIKLPEKGHFNSVLKKNGDWIRNELKLTTQSLMPVIKSQRKTLFASLDSTGLFESLKSVEVMYVDGLRVITPLQIGEPLERRVGLFLQQDGHKISVLISKSIESSRDRIKRLLCKELNKLMGNFLGAEFIDLVWGKERDDVVDVIRDYKGISLKKAKKGEMAHPESLIPVSDLERIATRNLVIEENQKTTPRRIKSPIKKKKRRVEKLSKPPPEEEEKIDWSRNTVEERAISLILKDENEDEENAGYVAIDVHKRKLGYDAVIVPIQITSRLFSEKKHGHLVRKFIEVKASKVDSDDFVITVREWEKADLFKDRYFLYRVINTMSKYPIAFVIDNPAEQYRDAIVERTARVIEDWRKRPGIRMKEISFGSRSNE